MRHYAIFISPRRALCSRVSRPNRSHGDIKHPMRAGPLSEAGCGRWRRGNIASTNVTQTSQTAARVILKPGATGNAVTSQGAMINEGQTDNAV